MMRTLTEEELEQVAGGMRWEGNRTSENVIDCRSGSCYDTRGIPMTQTGEYAFDP